MKRIQRFFDSEWKIFAVWAIIWLANLLVNVALLLTEIAKHGDLTIRIVLIILDAVMVIACALTIGIELGKEDHIY